MSLWERVFAYELPVHVFGRSPFLFSSSCPTPTPASARSAYRSFSPETSQRNVRAPLCPKVRQTSQLYPRVQSWAGRSLYSQKAWQITYWGHSQMSCHPQKTLSSPALRNKLASERVV